MTSRSINVPGELNRLVEAGFVTERALQAITQIDAAKLHMALADKPGEAALISADQPVLTADESMRLSVLAAQLTDGASVGDDDRISAIIESLNTEVHLSVENIAQLTGVDVEDLKGVRSNPRSVPSEVKYSIALRCSNLLNTVNLARGR